MRVASKVGKLRSEYWHAKPSSSPAICYVRDRRTDGRTDKSKHCPISTGGGIIIVVIGIAENAGFLFFDVLQLSWLRYTL